MSLVEPAFQRISAIGLATASAALCVAVLVGCSYSVPEPADVTDEPTASDSSAQQQPTVSSADSAPTASAVNQYGEDANEVLGANIGAATWDSIAEDNCSKAAYYPESNVWSVPSLTSWDVDREDLIAYSVAVSIVSKCPTLSRSITKMHPEFSSAIWVLDSSLPTTKPQPTFTPAPTAPTYQPAPTAPSAPAFTPATNAPAPVYGGGGYVVPCMDGSVSHSGGHQGACSHHGGTN